MALNHIEPVVSLPLDRVVDAPHNPRQTYPEATLQELADSIAEQGVLQPIIVREKPNDLLRWEIVCGHRRVRAARLACLDEIPAVVREMSDLQADLARLHENAEREDIHWLEEADAIRRLMNEHQLNIDQLVEKVNRPGTWVRARLKMAEMHAVVRERCLDNTLGAEVATLIARLPVPLQPKAMDRCLYREASADPGLKVYSYRQCRDMLRSAFTIPLRDARFDTEDSTLPRLAGGQGTCGTCLSNSDVDTGLEELGPLLCCAPECFKAREAESERRRLDRLRAQGRLVEGDAAQALMDSDTLVRVDSWVGGLDGPTKLPDLLAAASARGLDVPDTQVVVIEGNTHRRTVEGITRAQLAELQTQLNVKLGTANATDDDDEAMEAAAAEARWAGVPLEDRAVLDREAWALVRPAIVARLPHIELSVEDLRLLAYFTIEMADSFTPEAEAAVGWPDDLASDTAMPRRELVAKMDARQLATLLLADVITQDSVCHFMAHEEGQAYKEFVRRQRLDTARRYGVDVVAAAGLQVDAAHPQADLLAAMGTPPPWQQQGRERGRNGGNSRACGDRGGRGASAHDPQREGRGEGEETEARGRLRRQSTVGRRRLRRRERCGGRSVRALSIRQPWAWLIVQGHKPVENRDWSTSYRGPLLIHAGKVMAKRYHAEASALVLDRFGIEVPGIEQLQRGGVVGAARLVDCVSESDSPWFDGDCKGFVLAEPMVLPFHACKGALSFFNVPVADLAADARQTISSRWDVLP
jgi:ParB/RepB/Spo0J family partition protein